MTPFSVFSLLTLNSLVTSCQQRESSSAASSSVDGWLPKMMLLLLQKNENCHLDISSVSLFLKHFFFTLLVVMDHPFLQSSFSPLRPEQQQQVLGQ